MENKEKLQEKEKTEETEPEEHILSYEELNDYHKLIYPYQQHLDPKWKKYYYFNQFTGESVWELPENIQSKVTLFFERLREHEKEKNLRNMDDFVENIDDKIEESRTLRKFDWMSRPARRQVDTPLSARFAYKQGDEVYNIWYDKFLSDDKFKEREQALTKINPELDTGYTKADVYGKGQSYFCIHFARGCCVEGHKCRYYHHIPTLEECLALDQIRDIFGRTRFSTQRDDNEGVGSFMKETRTLRVSDFCMCTGEGDMVAATYEVLWRHFGTLGDLEDIHLIPERCISFIRFAHRCMAEFAKEAMANQPLESNEIMICRWADSDIIAPEDLNKGIQEEEEEEKPKEGGKKRRKKNIKTDLKDRYREDIEQLKAEEKLLGKRMDMDKEVNFVEHRLEQIRNNAEVMDSVLKKLKTAENPKEDKKEKRFGKLNVDDFLKKINNGKNPSKPDYINPSNNNAPLF